MDNKNKLNLYLANATRKFEAKTKAGTKKIIFGLFVFAIVLAMLLQPFSALKAAGPRFNIFTPYSCTLQFNRDYFIICVKNDTKGTDYGTSVFADPGDILTFSVYYHNGVNNTVASNTKLKAILPSGSSKTQTVAGLIWADNAENAMSSNPLSFSNTVNISSAQSLEFIAGSAQWFPNQKSPLFDAPTPFLFGQSGNEIVGGGINVGDIEGCWEFSGMVNFKVKVSQIVQNANLTISKTVKNLTKNEITFLESTNAGQGERVAFNLKIDSTGNALAQNVMVQDALPFQLSYVAGSTKIDGSSVSDGITSGGINLGSMNQGSVHNVTLEATVTSNTNNIVTNTGYVQADNVSQKQDTATVNINQISLIKNLTIVKQIRNVTENQYQFVDSIQAKPRQTLEFLIKVTSTGDAAITNVIVTDSLPNRLVYIAGSTYVDGSLVFDGVITPSGINIGSINPGMSKTIIFRVNVEREVLFTRGDTTLINSGFARADGVGEKSDTAQVVVTNSGCDPQNSTPARR